MPQEYRELPGAVAPVLPVIVNALIAAPSEPILLLCVSGKDRTAVAVAHLLERVGVAREANFEGCLESRVHCAPDRIAKLRSGLRVAAGNTIEENIVAYLAGVEASHLQARFDAIGSQFGSVGRSMGTVVTGQRKRAELTRALAS